MQNLASTFWGAPVACTIPVVLAEILTIGDELCRGEIVDTNSSWLAAALWDLDVTVAWMTSCRDEDGDMRRAFADAAGRADLVLVSGGLGPTEDDRTVDVLSAILGVEPVIDEPARQRMEARFAGTKYQMTPNNLRQAQVPAGARVLGNPAGLAPGFEVAVRGVPVICMPGVPSEMKAIFDSALRERVIALREAAGERIERIARRIYRVFGAGESQIAHALSGICDGVPGASLHYQVQFPEVLVKIVIRDRDADAAASRLQGLDSEVRQRLGRHLYGTDQDSLPGVLGKALLAAGATMATAESCTGGLIGALMTDVSGASSYFHGGAITYTNEEKTRQLGVPEEIFREHGAVSEPCVIAMAQGARERFGVDYAVAVSGIAGPTGGTPDKPVGTVWLAVAGPAGIKTRHLYWPGDRERVRRIAAFAALAMVLGAVSDSDRGEDAP